MKQFKLSAVLSSLLLLIAFNSACQKKDQTVKLITADSLKTILNVEHGMLLDVRTPEEYAAGHIQGAVNIDYNNENFSAALDTLDKNKQYVVYCRSGRRSEESINLMVNKGFKRLVHLNGGILQWQEKGYETVK